MTFESLARVKASHDAVQNVVADAGDRACEHPTYFLLSIFAVKRAQKG